MFFFVSICVILDLAVASPVSNVDNVRMASPSHVRSEDVPTTQSYKDHTIFNVPLPELTNKPPPFYPPQISNQPMNQAGYQNPIVNLIEKGTKYLQNPSVLSSQQSVSEIYQNGGGNIQTPIQRLQKLYQESSTLQKLLSNLNLIRNILAPKPQKKQFILVYPNGTIGYEDNISTVLNKYPNHIILKSSELRKLTNVEDEIQNGSDHLQPQDNIRNISSSTTQSNIDNQNFDINKSNSKSIVVNNNTESKNNIEEINTEVIDTTINETQYNSVIQNTLNDSASKISQLENSENLAYNTNNTTSAIRNISDSNQNVEGIDTSNITGNITLREGSENISNAYNNIQNLQNTTINKVDEANTELSVLTNENQNSINSNTELLHNITSENSHSSEDIANPSNATNNGLDDGNTATTPEYNITLDSDDAIGNIGSNNHDSSLVINNTNTQEDLTTNTYSEDITNVEHINDSLGGNVTNVCQCSEEEIENDEDGNIELGEPDSVSWVQLAKESAKNILFGEENPNVFFIFFNPPEMDIERESKTTTYPNGTVVEEFIEIRKVDGTTIRTSTTKTYNSSSTIQLTRNR